MTSACCSAYLPAIDCASANIQSSAQTFPNLNDELFQIYQRQATEFTRLRQYQKAEPLWLLALEQASSFALSDARLEQLCSTLGAFYRAKGTLESSADYYNMALALTAMQWGSDHPRVARYLIQLAEVHCDQNRVEVAEHLYRRARTILNRANIEVSDVRNPAPELPVAS